MAKIIVSLPKGWDNRLVMDSKDFDQLCNIFERSYGCTEEYLNGSYVLVAAAEPFSLQAKSGSAVIMGLEEFKMAKNPTEQSADNSSTGDM